MGGRVKAFEVRMVFEPKTYDIDYAGIVSNQVYIRWLEDMRFEVIRQHFGWENFPPGVVPVLLRTEIDYVSALRLFDRVEGRMWISGLDNVRWIIEGEFVKIPGDNLVARARHEGIFYDTIRRRPVRVPGELKRAVFSEVGKEK